MPSLSDYHLTRVSVTLDVGHLLIAPTPDLGHQVSPLGRSSMVQPRQTIAWFPRQTHPYTVIQVYALTSNAEEAEVE